MNQYPLVKFILFVRIHLTTKLHVLPLTKWTSMLNGLKVHLANIPLLSVLLELLCKWIPQQYCSLLLSRPQIRLTQLLPIIIDLLHLIPQSKNQITPRKANGLSLPNLKWSFEKTRKSERKEKG